jgi:alpha-glucosidase
MPDLNLHHPDVQAAILAIADFWLARGVDGFRLDTANLYFHDRALRDNPALPPERRGASPVLMQEHRYNADQPETPRFLETLRRRLDEHGERMAVGEIGGADWDARMAEYTEGTQRLHTAYSFAFLGPRPTAAEIAQRLLAWSARSGWPSWAFSNHDVPRVATRWSPQGGNAFDFGLGGGGRAVTGDVPAQTWMALLLALRGTVFIYQGEELGLDEAVIPFEQIKDPFGLAHWPLATGRDGCRTPMPWVADAPHAGFSTHEPWLPVWPAHHSLAVDRQDVDPDSMLATTRTLIALRRRHPALRHGALVEARAEGDLLHLVRRHDTSTVHALFNLGATPHRHALDDADRRTLWCHRAMPTPSNIDLPPGAAWYGLGDT